MSPHLDSSRTHEETLWTLRVVVTPVSDGHGRTSDSELSYIEVAAAAEAELRSFVYDLSTSQQRLDARVVRTDLVKGGVYVVRELDLCNSCVSHGRQSNAKSSNALLR